MFIYIIILVVLFFLGLWDVGSKKDTKEKRIAFYSIIIFFWILSFIRWETGTDWDSYLLFFEKSLNVESKDEYGWEPLFFYLNYLVRNITSSYWFYLMIVGFIILSLTSSTIYKYSPYPFVSILVYLMLRKCDVFFVRESIALAICMFSLRYIIGRKLLKFLLCLLIAIQFHRSVLIFLPAYFLFNLKWNYKRAFVCLIIFLIIANLLNTMFSSLISQLGIILGSQFESKAGHYIDDNLDYAEGVNFTESMVRGVSNRIVILLLLLYANLKQNSSVLRGLTNIYFFSIFLFIATFSVSVVIARVVNSYDITCIVSLGYFFNSVNKRNKQVLYLIFYAYMATRFVYGTLYGLYSSAFVPYKSLLL